MRVESTPDSAEPDARDPREEIRKRWGRLESKEQSVPKAVEELHTSILRLVSDLRHRDAELLTLFRKMEKAKGYEALGCYSMADYVALLLGVDDLAARERVRVARALGTLPALEEALRDAKISYAKVRAVTRVATPDTESRWLQAALELTAQQLEWEVARSRRGGMRPRKLWMKPVDAETTRMIVELPAEEMEIISQALNKVRRDGGGVVSNPEALVFLAVEAMDSEFSNAGSSTPFQIVVHLDSDSLSESGTVTAVTVPVAESGEWKQSGTVNTSCGKAEVPARRVEQMLCDGQVIVTRHLEDGSLETLDRVRTIPVATRRAILARDGGRCQVPGCGNRLWLDIHHCTPWYSGGEHTQSNLLTLCRHHHGAVHEGRIKVHPSDKAGGKPRFFVGSWEIGSDLMRADLKNSK